MCNAKAAPHPSPIGLSYATWRDDARSVNPHPGCPALGRSSRLCGLPSGASTEWRYRPRISHTPEILRFWKIVVHKGVITAYAAVMTKRNGDMSVSGPRRVTVEDASRVLGISESAIRKRIERNTLRSVRENGTRYVLLEAVTTGHDTDTTRHVNETTADLSTTSTALIDAKDETIAELRSRVESLERQLDARQEEIRRRDHLLAAALERIPELLPSPGTEPQESPQTVAEDAGGSEPHPATEGPQEGAEPRSWWRRWFGFE